MFRKKFGNALKAIYNKDNITANKFLKECIESDDNVVSRKAFLLYLKNKKDIIDIDLDELEWLKKWQR